MRASPLFAVITAASAWLIAGAATPPGMPCNTAAMQAAAPAGTTIGSAEWLTAPVPHCRIDGYVTTQDPGPNRNNFRLQLPERKDWNRRFYFIGLGGSGGYVPTESQIPRGNPIVRGFAVAGTDKGHQGPALDWSFNADPAKALDNAHRGAHVTTLAAQRLTRAYYGVRRMFRYHTGCSGGGDMGMKAIQVHPGDYDGVLLGVPLGIHPDPEKASLTRNFATMVREMTREPGAWLSPAKRAFAERKVVEACDMADGARDEMIWDHRLCKFDFAALQCPGADGADCLTAPEVRSFTQLVAHTASPISNIGMWSYLGDTPPPWNASASPENLRKAASSYIILNGWARTQLKQPERDIQTQPLSAEELRLVEDGQTKAGEGTPGGVPDIGAFERLGGKALFYVGVGDPCCSNLAMQQFFLAMERTMGKPRIERAARLFEVPGWGHCGGGNGPDDGQDRMLAALIDWVEHGRAPAGIVMHRGAERAQLLFAGVGGTESGVAVPRPSGSPRDFLVCRFPMVSVFDRSKAGTPGAVWDARNWSCQAARPG